MFFREHRPSFPLSEFIDALWYCRTPALPHSHERVLPSGTTEIIIDLRESHPMPDFFVGVHTGYITIETADLSELIGIHFKPGGATAFLPPAHELSNRETPLADLWSRTSLREQLLDTPALDARFRILEMALLKRLKPPRRHPAVVHAIAEFTASPDTARISAVTRDEGLSSKRFIDLFRNEVGITPKRYCRIRRFRQVLQAVKRGEPIRWSDIATTCGYFDQAHFIRDFRAFSGLSPTQYLERPAAWPGHVPAVSE